VNASEIVSAERAEVLREDRIGPVDADDLARTVIALHARVAELTRERDEAWSAGAEAMREAARRACEDWCASHQIESNSFDADGHGEKSKLAWAKCEGAGDCELAVRSLPLPERTEVPRG